MLIRALMDIGVASYMPVFGHLPYVMGEGNKKLSKRTRSPTCSCSGTAASSPKAC